jgi:hypothetical protein
MIHCRLQPMPAPFSPNAGTHRNRSMPDLVIRRRDSAASNKPQRADCNPGMPNSEIQSRRRQSDG